MRRARSPAAYLRMPDLKDLGGRSTEKRRRRAPHGRDFCRFCQLLIWPSKIAKPSLRHILYGEVGRDRGSGGAERQGQGQAAAAAGTAHCADSSSAAFLRAQEEIGYLTEAVAAACAAIRHAEEALDAAALAVTTAVAGTAGLFPGLALAVTAGPLHVAVGRAA